MLYPRVDDAEIDAINAQISLRGQNDIHGIALQKAQNAALRATTHYQQDFGRLKVGMRKLFTTSS